MGDASGWEGLRVTSPESGSDHRRSHRRSFCIKNLDLRNSLCLFNALVKLTHGYKRTCRLGDDNITCTLRGAQCVVGVVV